MDSPSLFTIRRTFFEQSGKLCFSFRATSSMLFVIRYQCSCPPEQLMLRLVVLHLVDSPTHQLHVVDHVTYRPINPVHRCIHVAVSGVVLHRKIRQRTQPTLFLPEFVNLLGGDIELSCRSSLRCFSPAAPDRHTTSPENARYAPSGELSVAHPDR